ncbi:hypothetical protein WQ57_07715 [Mesobacillus campisalis]|uniref:Amino acid transporter n=1 Tax=Mesobacillus campisalis TaxID=1408103 RepID=A0A0M2SXQ1_9BACI|nr:hypothetical protein WQ57_07715 [Mesobacillus campisalis]
MNISVQLLASYIVLGITLAAPIGPVNSARLEKGIKNGFWHAWVVGTGSMILPSGINPAADDHSIGKQWVHYFEECFYDNLCIPNI